MRRNVRWVPRAHQLPAFFRAIPGDPRERQGPERGGAGAGLAAQSQGAPGSREDAVGAPATAQPIGSQLPVSQGSGRWRGEGRDPVGRTLVGRGGTETVQHRGGALLFCFASFLFKKGCGFD